jgi:hypothetical protein
MTNKTTLIITSVVAAVLGTLHISDDIVRGIEPGGTETYTGMLIVVVWLYATLALSDRRWGLALILLLAIGGAAVPYLHMKNGLTGGRIANTSGVFFWVWTLFMLGVTSMFTVALSARELWRLRSHGRLKELS